MAYFHFQRIQRQRHRKSHEECLMFNFISTHAGTYILKVGLAGWDIWQIIWKIQQRDRLSGNAKTALSGELKSPQTQHSLDLDNLCNFGGKYWRQDKRAFSTDF